MTTPEPNPGPSPEPRSEPESALVAALEAAAAAPTLLVAADFDGVLAGFTLDPDQTRPDPDSLAALTALSVARNTYAALVSGRDVPTLRRLTGIRADQALALVGSHGAESSVSEVVAAFTLDDQARRRLDQLTVRAAELVRTHPGSRLERKRAGVAVHTRGLPAPLADAALSAARELADADPQVRVINGKSVVELSVSHADKGTAVQALAQHVGADATVYLGDDVTDEDAFRALGGPPNVTIKVGAGDSAAGYRVAGIETVAIVLDLLRSARRGDPR